jgi:allantoate deiminase
MITNRDRIKMDIEALSHFNATPGEGLTRFSLTPEDRGARNYLIAELERLNVHIYEDAAGSLIGRREGANPTLPPIIIGSHFDSVKNGGNFDGPAGVVTGLEILRCLEEHNVTLDHTVEMIAMIEEEGGRFGSGVFASRAMAYGLTLDELTHREDADGTSMAEAMKAFGLDPEKIGEAKREPGDVKAFIELHIEQGPVLEKEGIEVGLVTDIVGIDQCRITFKGRPDHAGTTPMPLRADALVAASKVVVQIPQLAAMAGEGTVATVGSLEVKPGAANIVPGEVIFTVDIRSKDAKSISEVKTGLLKAVEAAADRVPVAYKIDQMLDVSPVAMDAQILAIFEEQVQTLGLSAKKMHSGAGHDAMVMAAIAPTGLIFVPSKDGRSHCPEEWTDYAELQKGIELVYHTLLTLGGKH